MYMRLNKGHSIFLPLIQVVLLVDSMSSQLLNIVPNGFNGVCPYNQNETCLTLSELASNTSRLDQANITLNFLPGDHVLAQRISVSSAVNLVLTGHVCNASQFETNINCQGTSGFEFENIETINFTGLAFSGCGGEGTNGGALNINNVTFVSILSCHFIGNRVFGEKALGGAVYIVTAFDVSIHSSYFVNNSAQCEYNVHRFCDSAWNGGGAIFILDSREAVLISCHFERNIASTHGGAIASTRTTLVVSHTMFVYNQAFSEVVFSEGGNLHPSNDNYNETKSGGAIYVTKGNISASNCDFEFNTAIRGGAIHISQGKISTLKTNYIGNLANNFGGAIFINASFLSSENDCFKSNNASNAGGAIISYGGSLFSTHTYYSGNSADTGGAIYVDRFSRIASSHDNYINNSAALFGGGIGSNTSSISGTNNTYSNNRAESGGAIYLEYSYMSGVGGYYEMNRADLLGGVIYASNANVSTSDSYFINNRAKNGSIYISMGNVSMTGSNFLGNQAEVGSVIFAKNASVYITSSLFSNNKASIGGGVMYAETSSTEHFNSCYMNNSATIGGVFLIYDSSLQTSQSYYTNNRALQGGAIYAIGCYTEKNHACSIISNSSYYLRNSASQIGGAIYAIMYNVNVTTDHYSHNHAKFGGALSFSNFSYNNASSGGSAFHADRLPLSIAGTIFNNNEARGGGAIYSYYSMSLSVQNSSFTSNQAQQGAAILADHGNFTCSHSYYVSNNALLGGAISTVNGSFALIGCHFKNNKASRGAAMLVIYSSVCITSCSCTNNRARYTGGVLFAKTSTIKNFDSYYMNNSAQSGGVFGIFDSSFQTSQSYYTNNRATLGGAIYCNCTEQSYDSNHLSNSASQDGGAILTNTCDVNTTDDLYSYNHATIGGAMGVQLAAMHISGTIFSDNNATFEGGAIHADNSSLLISDTHFINNTATAAGGAIFSEYSMPLSMLRSNYTGNQAQLGGAIVIDLDGYSVATCFDCYYENNNALRGGAIVMFNGNLDFIGCHFKNNKAKVSGGAILINQGNVSSVNSLYLNNKASAGGAIQIKFKGSVTTTRSNYTGNLGGVIEIGETGSIVSSDSRYENNTGDYGGVMFINNGDIYSNRSQYLNNSGLYGGALYVFKGSVSCVNSLFKNNRARNGGSIYVQTNTVVSSIGCQYEDNIASYSGGAIWSVGGTITSTDTNYTNNYSDNLGGALFVFGGNISTRNSNFINNKAHRAGGAICALLSYVYSDSSHYGNNVADEYGGAIYVDSCTHSDNPSLFQPGTEDKLLLVRIKFICNEDEDRRPAFHIAKLDLSGNTLFTNNTCGLVGGAITSIQVQVCVNGTVPGAANNNTATYGGGLALVWSTLSVHSPIEIQYNKATMSGGGIFLYQSDIVFSAQEMMSIGGNTALQNGGGVYAINSYIKIAGGVVHFENNAAIKGAAIFLEQNSKIHLLKERLETVGEYDMRLEFINNHAQYGGAVLVSDSSENIIACERGVAGKDLSKSTQECFIQTLLSDTTVSKNNTKINYINVFFVNNTASVSGGAIYGGLLDRCIMNVSAELVTQFPEYQRSTGFDYIRATVQFAGLVDYDNLTLNYSPDKLINAITSSDVEGLVSSKPVRVCFCLEGTPNCSYHHPDVFTKRGQLFRLSVDAVDQVGNPINATVISSFLSNNGELNVEQARQETTTQCIDLEYNVYPKGDYNSSQIELYAEGPCSDNGISKRILNVIFLPCTCPIGFQSSETETRCSCLCDPLLATYIVNCSYENETVLRARNVWIDYVNTTAEDGYLLYPNCPFDYCVDKPVNVNLNILDGADIQCAFNRSGILCGACKKNMSLLMGSSRCQQCSNSFIALLIPFSLAGIALVAFVMALNLTVASGTIHGLIFYANILIASRSLFMPFETPNVLSIFISWINLDLGIETCFYNGMDSYAKVLLQLAFPTYIILITITIIIIREYSIRFATLIGKKDPVATLCTLILLSYSKLIRTIISSLQFTYLNYPDGSSEIVWLYDANVPYFSTSHIPRFITAIIIIILGFVYTVLIVFGQWIQRCGNRRFIRWVNNPKFNAFITKYHAPFSPKHRYWVGLLLFARFLHYLVSVFVTDAAILLSVFCIVGGLVLIKLLNYVKTYNNRILDALEVSFLVNLKIFVAATYYVGGDRGKQRTLAVISLSLSFITFWGILIYHSYMYILKGTQVWIRLKQSFQRIVQPRNRCRECEIVPLEEDEEINNEDEYDLNEQVHQMYPPYNEHNNGESVDLPHDHDPPVIVPAVRYDQLREPDLDILDPITTDDYRQLHQPPAPRPRQVPTTTVIDFVRPRNDGTHGEQ